MHRKIVLAGLTALCLLAAALVAIAGPAQAAPTCTPTGDALYDRFAQAVLSQEVWPPDPAVPMGEVAGWLGFVDQQSALVLPDEELAAWEDDFGGDPRYWQLRAFCAAYRQCNVLLGDEPDFVAGAAYLRTAWERGVADSETLLLLHLWEGWPTGDPAEREVLGQVRRELLARGSTAEEIQAAADLGDSEVYRLLGDSTLVYQIRRTVAPAYESLEAELLAAAIELAPDECWPRWRRANYWLNYGEPDLGLADLLAGNQAPVCRFPMCFPLSFIYDELAAGRVAGNKALAGLLLEAGALTNALHSSRDTVNRKERLKEAQVMLNLSGDRTLLSALYQMAARAGTAERRSTFTSYVAAQMAGIVSLAVSGQVSGEGNSPAAVGLRKIYQAPEYLREQIDQAKFERALAYPALPVFYTHYADLDPEWNYCELAELLYIQHEFHYYLPPVMTSAGAAQDAAELIKPLKRGRKVWDAWRSDYAFTEEELDWVFSILAEFDIQNLQAPETQNWSTIHWFPY